ncbi:MAG: hypothetical protein H6719_00790 [Sandaracinaceae bacterium]|nr:hypothetical protein [Sandaracinaceae bacterium]
MRGSRPKAGPATLAFAASAFFVSVGAAGCSCEGTRTPLAAVPEIPYPVEGDGELELERTLRSGPDMAGPDIVERFEIRRAGDFRIVRTRQEWPLGTADLDVVYDGEGMPVRVWRRTTMPAAGDPIGHRDVRVYGIGGPEVLIARRAPDGSREGVSLRGERPRAVIGPGRGMLTAWIQRAHLEVGGRLREPVLDVRESLALIRDVTLQREQPRQVAGLGQVRVYTIYGREPVFTDEHDVVIGDLMGMREASAVPGPVPDPAPDPGPFDPREAP